MTQAEETEERWKLGIQNYLNQVLQATESKKLTMKYLIEHLTFKLVTEAGLTAMAFSIEGAFEAVIFKTKMHVDDFVSATIADSTVIAKIIAEAKADVCKED